MREHAANQRLPYYLAEINGVVVSDLLQHAKAGFKLDGDDDLTSACGTWKKYTDPATERLRWASDMTMECFSPQSNGVSMTQSANHLHNRIGLLCLLRAPCHLHISCTVQTGSRALRCR